MNFHVIRTSIAKKPYIFVIFQGGGVRTPLIPSRSAHELLVYCCSLRLRGFCDWSWFCYTILSAPSSFALRKRELIDLYQFSSRWHVLINVLCLCPTVPWVDLQGVIVTFHVQTHLRFESYKPYKFKLSIDFKKSFKVDHLCYLCLVFLMLTSLFIAALWSPAGKG